MVETWSLKRKLISDQIALAGLGQRQIKREAVGCRQNNNTNSQVTGGAGDQIIKMVRTLGKRQHFLSRSCRKRSPLVRKVLN